MMKKDEGVPQNEAGPLFVACPPLSHFLLTQFNAFPYSEGCGFLFIMPYALFRYSVFRYFEKE